MDKVSVILDKSKSSAFNQSDPQGYLRLAILNYDKALAKDPNYEAAKWNRAVALERAGLEHLNDAEKNDVLETFAHGTPLGKKHRSSRLCGTHKCTIS